MEVPSRPAAGRTWRLLAICASGLVHFSGNCQTRVRRPADLLRSAAADKPIGLATLIQQGRGTVELVKDATQAEEPVALELRGAAAATLADVAERLKLEREVAQLRADLISITKPWWRRGSIVASMTAIIAAILPATTGIQGHYEKERELLLQESKQAHEIRTSYLDRLDKPGAKLRTLRFVEATTTDEALRLWAQSEKREIQAEVELEVGPIDEEIKQVDKELAALQSDPQPPAGAPTQAASTPPTPALAAPEPEPLHKRREPLLRKKELVRERELWVNPF